MSVVINTNSAATIAANNLATSSAFLQRSLNRLASGSKIINPQDDAAGLAVSMKLAATARRQNAVSANLGNAVSYLQTQDGALQVVGKVLNRISELKTLYADPTKNSDDLANYESEFTQLQSELTSLGDEKFNGKSLFGSSSLAIGATADGTSQIDLEAANLLGSGGPPAWSNISGIAPGADWTASSVGIANSGGYTRFHTDGTLTSTQSNISGPYQMAFTFNGVTVGSGTIGLSGGGSGSLDFTGLAAMDGNDHTMAITVDSSGNATWSIDSGTWTGTVNNFASPSGGAAVFTVSNTGFGNDLHIQDGFTLTSTGGGGSSNTNTVATAASLSALNLSDITGAISDVATLRAQNGASQSRLQFADEVLRVNKANIEAANSRITDVDVAEESTSLARYNILVQSGTAMLTQANQSAQMALRLLG